jgi:hypothetical protein
MRRRSLVVAVSLAAIVALAGCSDDSDDTSPSTTTSSSTSTTTTSTTTTVPATTTSPSTAPPTAPPTTPTTAPAANATQCAQLLFAAWAKGSEPLAPACAPPEQVQTLFSQPYVGPYTGPACEGAAGSLYCTWIGPDGVVIQVQNMPPFTVTSVTRRPA